MTLAGVNSNAGSKRGHPSLATRNAELLIISSSNQAQLEPKPITQKHKCASLPAVKQKERNKDIKYELTLVSGKTMGENGIISE